MVRHAPSDGGEATRGRRAVDYYYDYEVRQMDCGSPSDGGKATGGRRPGVRLGDLRQRG
jgi:hypothetical protein